MHIMKLSSIITVLLASPLSACLGAESNAPSNKSDTDFVTPQSEVPAADLQVAQSVPEPLLRQIVQTRGSSSDTETLRFFAHGPAEDGHQRFTVIIGSQGGPQHASVVYDHDSQTLQGCIDVTCAQRTIEIEFTSVTPRPGAGAARQPNLPCAVAFYEHESYTGSVRCYDLPNATAGSTYVIHSNVTDDNFYSSHMTYNGLCNHQNIGNDCTNTLGYKVNINSLRVFKDFNFKGYDRWMNHADSNYSSLRWCGLCGSINDQISSFIAEVQFVPNATLSGSLTTAQEHHYSFNVLAGTRFRAAMTGSGDPDIYVRFGAQPTVSTFDCRPYSGSASEVCELVVPAGYNTAHVMVRGYTSATYNLEVNYNYDL